MIKKIIINLSLFLALLLLLIGGINFLDYVGILNKEKDIYPYLSRIPYFGKFFMPKEKVGVNLELLKEEELRKLKEEIDLRLKELDEKEKILAQREEKLEEKKNKILALEDEVLKRKKGLEDKIAEYEDQENRWRRLAIFYQKMSPKRAAEILAGLDDQSVINILMRMEDATVAITLMEMEPKRAAEITRKMTR